MTLPSNANLPQYPAFANARSYDAEFDRMAAECSAFGEGIAPFDQSKDCTVTSMGSNKATDLEVVTNASGLQVSVALGNAWVKGDGRSTQGLYFCYVPTANVVTMPTAHATLPRVDAVVLKVEDADVSGSATQWSVTYQQGTATGGASLANLTGAPGQGGGPSFAASQMLLGYVLTTAAFAGPYVTATHILDQRCFAYRPGRVLGFLTATSDSANAGDKLGPLTVGGNGVNDIVVDGKMSISANSAGAQCYWDIRDAAAGAGTKLDRAHFNVPSISYVNTMSAIGFSTAVRSLKSFYAYLASSAGTPQAWESTAGTVRRLTARYK